MRRSPRLPPTYAATYASASVYGELIETGHVTAELLGVAIIRAE